jgi:GT2 family glycosyltransferase
MDTAMSVPDVTISIVSFNTRELLNAALRAVLATTGVSCEIVVVDNGSADGSADMVEREFPAVQLIRNPDNRGFAAANNLAIRRASGRYLLLLNPDTEVRPDTIPTLVGLLDTHPQTGICGPRILFPDGTFQSCGYRFPSVLSEIRQSKNMNRAIKALVGPEPFVSDAPGIRDVDWVDGACLMIRRAVIDQIGPLDEQYFLYAEELDWCFNARKAGWAITSVATTEMVHHLGQSSSQVSDRSLVYFIETRLRFYRKNRGLMTAMFVSLVYVAGCLKQMRREPHKSTVKLTAVRLWWGSLLSRSR